MGSNPLNLTIRFVLEMAALVGIGRWGWTVGSGFSGVILAVVLVVVAAGIWGTFNVPGDPSRSGKAPVKVPGWLRLLIELAIFGAAALAWFAVGPTTVAIVFSATAAIHYIVSYDRIRWLLAA